MVMRLVNGGQTLEDKASRPRPRPDLVEAKAKVKVTIFCPRGVLEVEGQSSRTPSLVNKSHKQVAINGA